MSRTKEADSPEWLEKDFLYTVLNLPTYASQSEIKERHRSLSLIYHPDKLRNADESTRETAKKRFLEVQKAYEVLSDPFLREVYDTLGYEGLRINLPPHIRTLPLDELPSALYRLRTELQRSQLEARVHSRGRLLVGFDVRELFAGGWIWREWHKDLAERLGMSGLTAFSVRHSFEKELASQTKMVLHGTMNQGAGDDVEDEPGDPSNRPAVQRVRGNIVANIVHRHSSKVTISATAPLLRRHRITLTPSYSDGTNHVQLSTSLFPNPALLYPYPPTNLSISRRLFRDSLTLGTLSFQFNPLLPTALVIAVNKPCITYSTPRPSGDGENSAGSQRTPSSKYSPGTLPLLPSGFSLSLNLRTFAPGPSIAYEYLVAYPIANLRAKCGFEFSLAGLSTTVTGEWNNDEGTTGLGWAVAWGATGVVTRISVTHLGQEVVLPLVLSSVPNPKAILFATVVPVTAYGLADFFFLRHERVQKRIAQRNAQRQAHSEEIQSKKREAQDTSRLLKDIAKRHAQVEKNKDGLIILEATYLPIDENGEPISELGVTVTDVLQALVHNGQLFIPGNRSKSSIRGFFDPMPEFSKRLCVRYEFRGKKHYVEVEDWDPVVMPLEDHLVEENPSRTR